VIFEFPHTAPEGYSYEQVSFKRNVVAIWIHNHYEFSYNNGGTVASIWGFYNLKTKCYHSPVNAKTVGDQVNIVNTTPYSAMIPKLTPLQSAFL
jgi:hypothetical protein